MLIESENRVIPTDCIESLLPVSLAVPLQIGISHQSQRSRLQTIAISLSLISFKLTPAKFST